MSDIVKDTANLLGRWLGPIINSLPSAKEVETIVIKEVAAEMRPIPGQFFVRLAGLSGAVAVAMGAYGAHAFREKEPDENLKHVFDTGNKYHFLHTLALLAVPLTRRPYLVGTLTITGMILFSGSCYYHALTGSTAIRRVTPYGGMTLIAAWASMIL